MGRDLIAVPSAASAVARAVAGQYLTFTLGAVPDETTGARARIAVDAEQGEFGLPILSVREIMSYVRPMALPGTADDVRGTINLRGSAVPVIDLAQRLGLGTTPVRARTCIVVVEVPLDEAERRHPEPEPDRPATQWVGFLADAVNEVIDVEDAQLRPVPSVERGQPAPRLLAALAQREVGGFVALLAASALLDAREAIALADAATSAPTEQA